MAENLIYIVFGFVLLFVGGDYLVRAAVSLAHHFGMSPFVVGVTIVGFGTSVPELVTSLNAVFNEVEGIAVGNIIGSNISNCLLVLGVAALISPLYTKGNNMVVDGGMLILATLWLVGNAYMGGVSRPMAGFGLFMIIALTTYSVCKDRQTQATAKAKQVKENSACETGGNTPPELDVHRWSVWSGTGVFVLALAVVLSGADNLVDGAVGLAMSFGVSDELVGVTIVAIGTSLPELAAAIAAACRKEQDLALGNVIGSNLFNIFGILAITSLVKPVAINFEAFESSLAVLVISTVAVLVFAWTGRRISRTEGAIFLSGFVVFVGLQISLMNQ